MRLAELSVRRHVLALMLSMVFVLFGLVAYQRIGVDRFPRIEFPVVSITTVLPGANPDVVDSSITNIIGNGHTVYYDAAACPELGGLTYTLVGGGTLQPAP